VIEMIRNKDNIREQIIEEFSKTIQLFGLTSLEARVYTFLYLSNDALTLDEMSKALGNSKTAISTNIRSLVDKNLVKRVWRKGVRKDLYEGNKELYKVFMNFYTNKWMMELKYNETSLLEIQKDLMVMNKENVKTDPYSLLESELNKIIDFHRQVEDALNKIKKE
jgi:DNA-binding transcriptional regulator GbsR (MarR family)